MSQDNDPNDDRGFQNDALFAAVTAAALVPGQTIDSEIDVLIDPA